MKSVVAINTSIPTVDYIDYFSGESLRDYDIAVFDPEFPLVERIGFRGGGSCISIEGTASLMKAISHWNKELHGALHAGKTLFVILNEYKDDLAATGINSSSKTQINYKTSSINNYSAIPTKLDVSNSIGNIITVCDSSYINIYNIIKNIMQYRVIINSDSKTKKIFTAKDGATVAAIKTFENCSGSIVFLPYFYFSKTDFTTLDDDRARVWNDKALAMSNALVSQMVAIDKFLKEETEHCPPPTWIELIEAPKIVVDLDGAISDIDARISTLQQERDVQDQSKNDILEFSHLLYETGKPLERAIEKTLRLLGYAVETLRVGDLEIDHVIVGPSGKRMIGESEGKNSSAINISKFRQLESNIGEDFEREEIFEPAKGLLFGNGFRLTLPSERPEQFTQKSLVNAKRLGSALIQTADLYSVAVHLLNHPENEDFKAACRSAIEDTEGGVVKFPAPSSSLPRS